MLRDTFGHSGALKISDAEINRFFDSISEEIMYLKLIFLRYLNHESCNEVWRNRLQSILNMTEHCNTLRYLIIRSLYTEFPFVNSREGIVDLFEEMFTLLDSMIRLLRESIDEIFQRTDRDYLEGCKAILSVSIEAVETIVSAMREFLNHSGFARNYINHVYRLGSEADGIEVKYRSRIAGSNLSAERVDEKNIIPHLRQLVGRAETIGDKLSIYYRE